MISKKRYWGLALPIYECRDCGNCRRHRQRDRAAGARCRGLGRVRRAHSPHRPWIDDVKIACSKCGETVSRIKDVGNPWLDAGIVPFSTLHYRNDRGVLGEVVSRPT